MYSQQGLLYTKKVLWCSSYSNYPLCQRLMDQILGAIMFFVFFVFLFLYFPKNILFIRFILTVLFIALIIYEWHCSSSCSNFARSIFKDFMRKFIVVIFIQGKCPLSTSGRLSISTKYFLGRALGDFFSKSGTQRELIYHQGSYFYALKTVKYALQKDAIRVSFFKALEGLLTDKF